MSMTFQTSMTTIDGMETTERYALWFRHPRWNNVPYTLAYLQQERQGILVVGWARCGHRDQFERRLGRKRAQ